MVKCEWDTYWRFGWKRHWWSVIVSWPWGRQFRYLMVPVWPSVREQVFVPAREKE